MFALNSDLIIEIFQTVNIKNKKAVVRLFKIYDSFYLPYYSTFVE